MHLICILHKNSPKGNFHYKETFSFSYLGYKLFTKIYLKMFREFSYLYQKFKSCLSLSTFANAEIYIWKEDLEKTWGEEECKFILTLFRMVVKVWSVWLEKFYIVCIQYYIWLVKTLNDCIPAYCRVVLD